MNEDRFEQLERRIAVLEKLVRQLLTASVPARAVRPAEPADVAVVPSTPVAPAPRVVVRPRFEVTPPPSEPAIDWEQWVGQRGLLIVGVLALLATGGFFLNYAIQHGWIAPIIRASGAIAAGVALALWGDRLVRHGMLRYGAAIIGGGGGLVYLGVWAAAGPYALVSREVGVLLLAAVSGAVVGLAVLHAVEALAIWALVGAYLAPIFLATPEPAPAKFLAYLAVIGTSMMVLAERMSWRAAFNTALFGLFLLPAALIPSEYSTRLGVNYAVLGGVIALLATSIKRSPWPEARVGGLVMAWIVLFAASGTSALHWTALSAGALITALVWWQQLHATPLVGLSNDQPSPEFIVYLTPLALVTLGVLASPPLLAPWGGLLPLTVAAVYLASGWPLKAMHLLVMGFVLLALAVSGQWDGAAVAAGWAIVAVLAGASTRWGRRPGTAAVGAVLASLACVQLFTVALERRPPAEAAFIGPWSLAFYVCLLASGLVAQWWEAGAQRDADQKMGVLLWSIAALALLFGGSLQLERSFHASDFHVSTALVVYWVVFAVALVRGASSWRRGLCVVALRAAPALIGAAYLLLFTMTWTTRAADDRAFIGIWPLAWYAAAAAAVLGAHWWPAGEAANEGVGQGRVALWWMAGGCVLVGGSLELHRLFPSQLAGDLAISMFWLVYAGALVRAGFWLDQKAIRSAGLGVAALASLKIVLYDLSTLQALYRVASFFVLALITLAVAYTYNKRARISKASVV